MSFQKFKTISYCVGGRFWLAATNVYGDISSKGVNVMIGPCSTCNRKVSMTGSHNTIVAKRLGDFFKNLGRRSVEMGKKIAKNV